MDRSYVTENDTERARLKALVARLTDADMARAMSEGWTVGVGLMHLAFWDGLSLSKFEEWERTGTVQIPPMGDMVDAINDAWLFIGLTTAIALLLVFLVRPIPPAASMKAPPHG